jgi:hypothetical protein
MNVVRRRASALILLTMVTVPLSACGSREPVPVITGPALIFFYTDP